MPTVKFYASLRKVANAREATIEGGNVKEVLANLLREYPEMDRYLKISTVLVNGANVVHLKGHRTRLKPDDVVSIFPPMGGG